MINDFFGSFSWSTVTDALITVIPALICITIHELAHGFTAYRFGDRTAKDMGRLTLNPIKHIDVIGMLMLLLFKFGWAKPVPVDMRNFKRPRLDMAVTAFAGPASNIALAAVILFIYGLVFVPFGGLYGPAPGRVILRIIERTAYLSVALAVFNLIPFPPLDGSKVLFSFLSDKSYYKLMRYERYGVFVLLIIMNTPVFKMTVGLLTVKLYNILFAIARTTFGFVN